LAELKFGGYKASATGKQFHSSPALFRGLLGPIGSGKSVACCWELFNRAINQAPNADGVRKTRMAIIRQTYPELKSTTIKTWQDWFPSAICPIKFDAPITGHLKMPWNDGTQIDMEVVFLALERPEDVKKLLSLELTGGWVNEAREVPKQIVDGLLGRIGRYPAKRDGGHTRKFVIADTNPPDDDHWWYKFAEEETPKDWAFFQQPPAILQLNDGTYAPNPDAENVEHLEDGYNYWLDQIPGKDREWIKVYLEGRYGTIQDGRPVYGSSFNAQWHTSSVPLLPVRHSPVVLTLDFGLTPAAVFLQQMPGGQVRCLDEIVTESCGARQLCQNYIIPMLRDKYAGRSVIVTGDPAGSQRAQTDEKTVYEVLREELGPLVKDIIPAETNSLQARLDSVRQALNRNVDGRPMFLLSPDCKTLRKGFMGGYKFRRVSVAGNTERYTDAPDKNLYSHVHDALQYGMHLLMGPLLKSALKPIPSRQRVHAGDAIAGY